MAYSVKHMWQRCTYLQRLWHVQCVAYRSRSSIQTSHSNTIHQAHLSSCTEATGDVHVKRQLKRVNWLTIRAFSTKVKHSSSKQNSHAIEDHGQEDESMLDIEKQIDELLENASKRDVMMRSLSKPMVTKQIKALISDGFPETNLDVLEKYPNLLKNIPHISTRIAPLQKMGYDTELLSHLIASYPEVLTLAPEDILFVFQTLQDYGFRIEEIIQMTQQYPKILTSDLSRIRFRINELKELFKSKDTIRLLVNSPNLLFDDLEDTRTKFNYVFNDMGITQPQMRSSKLFSYPIEHVITRHMFLVRAGFFKKVKRKQGQIDLNPKLKTIIDTSDAEFAAEFGDMSVLDYKAFEALLSEEIVFIKDSVKEDGYQSD